MRAVGVIAVFVWVSHALYLLPTPNELVQIVEETTARSARSDIDVSPTFIYGKWIATLVIALTGTVSGILAIRGSRAATNLLGLMSLGFVSFWFVDLVFARLPHESNIIETYLHRWEIAREVDDFRAYLVLWFHDVIQPLLHLTILVLVGSGWVMRVRRSTPSQA